MRYRARTVSGGLFAALCAMLLLAGPAAAAPPGAFEDDGTQWSGMHNCPNGSVLYGVDGDNNRFMCADHNQPQRNVFVDTGTQQTFYYDGGYHSVHVCPQGSYMRGWHGGKNLLTCVSDPTAVAMNSRFVDSIDFQWEPNYPYQPVQVCTGTSIMVGIHDGDHKLICQDFMLSNVWY